MKMDIASSYPSEIKVARCDIVCGGKASSIWYVYSSNSKLRRVDVACMVMPVIRDEGLTVVHGDNVDLYSYHGADTVAVWFWELPFNQSGLKAEEGNVAYTIPELSELFANTLGALEDAE